MTAKTTAAKPAKGQKPAATEPANTEGVGIKELSKILNRNEKSVRAAIRRLNGGPQVGKGGRYSWKSENDPAFKQLVEALSAKTEKVEADA